MGRRDVKSVTAVKQLFTKISRSGNATVEGTDVSDFHGAAFCVDIDAHTSGTGFTVTFQHRDGNGNWTDIPHGDLDSPKTLTSSGISIAVGDANSQIYVGYTGNKEQIGAVLTRVTDGVMVFGVLVLKGYPSRFPVNA